MLAEDGGAGERILTSIALEFAARRILIVSRARLSLGKAEERMQFAACHQYPFVVVVARVFDAGLSVML